MKSSQIHPLNIFFYLLPTFFVVLIAFAIYHFIISPGFLSGLSLIISVYFVPLLTYRLGSLFSDFTLGKSPFDLSRPNFWFFSIRCQLLFIAFPLFENVLIIFPEAFNLWLRAWGSQIGSGTHFPPLTEITDRTMLQIGNHVIFGHRVVLTSHVIMRRPEGDFLYLKPIIVEDNVLVGALSCLTPGVQIKKGAKVPYGTHFKGGEVVT